jgi:2,3-bisphosphoglycerate-dependent phosphoglycerate mutase
VFAENTLAKISLLLNLANVGSAVTFMKCKLLVFRHAETFDNRRGIFSGWRDSTITPKGIRQAKVIAEQLKLCKIDYAFTSHLKRAKQTLELVLKDRKSIPIFTDDRLIERCYGLLQGRKKKQVKDKDPNFYEQCHRGYTLAPPEGESLEMVEKRVLSFLDELRGWLKQNLGNVAISCHGNSIRPLRKRFENLSLTKMCKLESPQDRALIYNLELGDTQLSLQKPSTSQIKWNGVLISKSIRLATDKRNFLKTYYR